MFKDNKLIKIIGIIIVAVMLVLIGAEFYRYQKEKLENKIKVNVYFLNPMTSKLEPEIHYVAEGEEGEVAKNVLNILLYEGPKNKNLSKITPDNIKYLEGSRLVDNKEGTITTLKLKFSSEYSAMSPTEELFFRGSLVWTMTELDFIDDVYVYVEEQELLTVGGQPVGYLNRENVIINPVISPDKINTQTVKLYFANSNADGLASEMRVVQVNPDKPIEKYILEQLIAGPTTPGLFPTVPPETKMKEDANTVEGICYVNLSSDFVSKHQGGSAAVRLTIYSIVNSLTELSKVQKVQFYIEAEKVGDFKGSFDLSKPIERQEDLIMDTAVDEME